MKGWEIELDRRDKLIKELQSEVARYRRTVRLFTFLLVVTTLLNLVTLAYADEGEVKDPPQQVEAKCPQPVTEGCKVTVNGLFGASCTVEDFIRNASCFDRNNWKENER
jgi:hypothetical protein